jgi:hypothetical protein
MIADDAAAGREFLAVPQHLSLAMSLSPLERLPAPGDACDDLMVHIS